MLRDDSATNISPAMFGEFVYPYDQQLMDEFGGGAIHFCGKGDRFINQMGRMRGLSAINMSQPELNDLETIFRQTIDRGINLLDFSYNYALLALQQGRDLHGRIHCNPG